MKKIFTVFIIFSAFIVNINAASFSLSVNCPSSANAEEKISCTIKVTPSGFSLRGLQISYSFSSGSYSNFELNKDFNLFTSTPNGLSIESKSPSTNTLTVGILKAIMPSSGNMVITFDNIVATDELINTIDGLDITKTIRVKSQVNTLSNLTISEGELSPSFDSNVISYSATVDAKSINIVATKTDSNSKVTGIGTKTLNYGENVFKVVVTSESGNTKTYTINITRPDYREKINTLNLLLVDGFSLNPAFSKETTTYNLTVNPNVASVKVEATKAGEKSSFVSGFGPRTINLKYGLNSVLIKVKSENESIKTYTINITRNDDRNKNNNLKSLLVNEEDISFNKNITSYALIFKNEIEKITIDGAVEDTKAKVSGLGTKKLKVGVNTFNVVVTAENEETKTYVLKITRLDASNKTSGNNNLKSLAIENYSINFDPEITLYNITIEDETELAFSFEAEDKTTSVIINGNENLKDGSIILVQVTSTDGSKKEYKFNISKNEKIDNIKGNKSNTKKLSNKKLIIYSSISVVSIAVIILCGIKITSIILKKKAMKWK